MITAIEITEIKETIIKDPGCKVYVCVNNPPKFLRFANVQLCSALAPQAKLVQDLKLGILTTDEFRRKYSMYLKNNPLTSELVKFIISESKNQDIYLIWNSHSECQRLVLMGMFDNISS